MTHIVHWKFVKRRGALFLEQRGEKQCFALSTYQAISMASLIISFFYFSLFISFNWEGPILNLCLFIGITQGSLIQNQGLIF